MVWRERRSMTNAAWRISAAQYKLRVRRATLVPDA